MRALEIHPKLIFYLPVVIVCDMEPIDEQEVSGPDSASPSTVDKERRRGAKKHERPFNPFRKHPNLLNEPSRCPIFLLRSRDPSLSEGRKSVSERNLVV